MARLTIFPPEIIFHISSFLPTSSKVVLLQTCRRLFTVMTVLLYRRVTTTGINARRLSLTVLTSRKFDYINIVHALDFRGKLHPSEMYMTYPVLLDALLNMNNLHTLTLAIPPSHSAYFSDLMRNKGLVRESTSAFAAIDKIISGQMVFSRNTLPNLRSFTFEGDIALIMLTKNRKISRLNVKSCMRPENISVILDVINRTSLINISLKLLVSTMMEFLLILYLIGEACTALLELDLDIGVFNALEISKALTTTGPVFKQLRTLLINKEDKCQPVFSTDRRQCYVIQLSHLRKASAVMSHLNAVTFGLVQWELVAGGFEQTWICEFFESKASEKVQNSDEQNDFSCFFFDE